jgi:hypothetical protein
MILPVDLVRNLPIQLAILAAAVCTGCTAHDSAQSTHAAAGARLQMLPADTAAARSLPHKGQIVQVARFGDALGEHTLLLTQTGAFPTPGYKLDPGEDPHYDAELYAYDYVGSGGGRRLLWRTVDFERDCPFDLYAGFLPGTTTITDLDGDGTAEVTFLYTTSCRSDVSPATRKLIMHEGPAKYAIRGATRMPNPGPEGPKLIGGEAVVDPSFKAAPVALRGYALRRWEQYVGVDTFEQLDHSRYE